MLTFSITISLHLQHTVLRSRDLHEWFTIIHNPQLNPVNSNKTLFCLLISKLHHMPETFFISLQLHPTHVWALLHQSSRCYDSIRHTRRRFRRRQTGVCKESRKLCAKIKDVRVEHKTGNKSRQREEKAVRSIGGLWKGRHDKRVICVWDWQLRGGRNHTLM